MKIAHTAIVALFVELGFEPASKWDVVRCNEKLTKLLEVIDDPAQVSADMLTTDESKQLFKEIKSAKKNGKPVIVEGEAEEEAPAAAPKKKLAAALGDDDDEAPAAKPAKKAPAAAEDDDEAPAAKPAKKGAAAKPAAKPAKEAAAEDDEAPAAKPAKKKPATERTRGSGKKNAFGAFLNSNAGKVDACLTKKPQSAKVIAEECGVPFSTANYRLWSLAKDKQIGHKPREGYFLKK